MEGNIEPDRSSSGWVDDDERDSQPFSSGHSSPRVPVKGNIELDRVLSTPISRTPRSSGSDELVQERPVQSEYGQQLSSTQPREVPQGAFLSMRSVKLIASSSLGGAVIGGGLRLVPGSNHKSVILCAGIGAAIGVAAAIAKDSCTVS